MSFAEKIAGLMARPGQDVAPRDDVPWHLKYGARILGIVGSFLAIFLGLWNCFSILLLSTGCLISGILQMLAGFLVMAIEAPCCCMFIDFVQQLADKADQRPYWNRAALYCIISIPPVVLCIGPTSFFGCGFIFGTGVLYGLMSLGKKASEEEMRSAAAQSGVPGTTTTSDRASIVNNAQPFSFTGAVSTDSNV